MMRRTIDTAPLRSVVVALIGILLVFAAPALAEAKDTPKATRADSGLIAEGAGYSAPHGSERVRAIQHRLIRAGERPGPVDGRFGPLTEAAVERFQTSQGLTADGIVGPLTQKALSRQAALIVPGAGYSAPHGSTRVRAIQHRLIRAGERPGPVDGRYGPLTEAAVERFQRSRGLAVDGIVGDSTARELDRFATVSHQRPQAHGQPSETPAVTPKPSAEAPPKPGDHGGSAPPEKAAPTAIPDRSGSGLPGWFAVLAVGIALLSAGALAVVLARRQRTAKRRPPDAPAWRQPTAKRRPPDAPADVLLFQARFHDRDGQSMMTAAELLSVAALVEGRDALAFPGVRCGPTGPRLVAFCRIGGRPLRPRESIGHPDGLIVQDPALLPLEDAFWELEPTGYLLINSTKSIEELGLGELVATLHPDRRLTIPANELARQYLGVPLPDSALVGGFAALTGAVSLASVTSSIRERFAGQAGDDDVAAAEAAFEYVERKIRKVETGPEPVRTSVQGQGASSWR
jgi:pyruvate ferredoxin oxidoreductase gamma subunit